MYDEEDEKKKMKALLKRIKGTSDIADAIVSKKDEEKEETCRVMYMLFDEAVNEYKTGKMKLNDIADELAKSLKAL